MSLADLTRDAVLSAINEFDAMGRDAFLARYGFGPARSYFLEYEGQQYDSKAIAGAAHGFIAPQAAPLTADAFSGGEVTVATQLRELGFTVTDGTRNPPWTRDELILALDLYLRNPKSPPGKSSTEVAELSSVLHLLGQRLGRASDGKYRNVNGVYMKMMNFRRFDPSATASGRVGLTRGNKEEEVVWREFASDPSRLAGIAAAITYALQKDEAWDSPPVAIYDDGLCEAPEGGVLTRIHTTRERNRKLVEKRKAAELAASGRLACVVCDFDYEATYGSRGRGFIEVHHTKPVHTLEDGAVTRLDDLALVCANCHRMIHSSQPWLSVDALRALLRS